MKKNLIILETLSTLLLFTSKFLSSTSFCEGPPDKLAGFLDAVVSLKALFEEREYFPILTTLFALPNLSFHARRRRAAFHAIKKKMEGKKTKR